MLLRTIAAFSLALSSSAFSAEGTYNFSHYACGTEVPHSFTDTGLVTKVTGSKLRLANATQEKLFAVDNFRKRELPHADIFLDQVIVHADGAISVRGVVDIAENSDRGAGFQGRQTVTYEPRGDGYVMSQPFYEATKKSTGKVVEYALGEPGDTGQAGWSVYYAFFFIDPILPVYVTDFRVSESSVEINLRKERQAVTLLCGDNATAYAVFTK